MEEINPKTHHEEHDVDVRGITIFGIGLALMLIASLFGLWLLFDHLKGRDAVKGPPPSAGLDVDARKLPPEPRLQPAPVLDLRSMREAEDEILNHYAWIDPDKGIVRIPISRAMDVLAQRGLPSRAQGQQP